MKKRPVRRAAAAWFAAWLLASAVAPVWSQSRAVVPVEVFSTPVAPAVPVVGAGEGVSAAAMSIPLSAPSAGAAASAPSAAVPSAPAPLPPATAVPVL
ncbi:MAG: hypothetical protein KGL74_14990, partial [Elusimicrobia bacterium]|nr:hypothetical protein [Elusimicrobiota bacterium]